jgi:molecular chaperone DnaK
MSRNRIDYGIDLGTTNSALARMENGDPVIKKNDLQSDTTPSAVAFGSKGRIRVGQQAYNQLKVDRLASQKSGDYKPNVFVEFKRTMGTDEKYSPAIQPDSVWTSEQLSAEVLKKLKDCVNDETVHAAVITIPAEFKGAQQQATLKAAELAGFKQSRLLQEPVAAAMVYGLDAGSEKGKWLVFDFGGGTFDSALVLVEDGVITVKDSEGDNFLGGKDLDMALVDEVIIPAIQQDYDIDHILSDSNKKENFRMAMKKWAEEAKIKLSYSDTHEVFSELGEIPLEDANGEEIGLDFVVTREQMAEAVRPIFQRAIDKSLALIARHGLKGEELDELILVGGPTLSPILREMLSNQMKAPNTSVDPMTCVARGAALFASTVMLDEATEKVVVEEASKEKELVVLDMQYESTSVSSNEFVTVKIKEGEAAGASVELERPGWSSGKVSIGEKGALVEVNLEESKSNAFEVILNDASGNRLECHPSIVTIIQGTKVTGAPLPNSLGVEILSGDKQVFTSLMGAEKGKQLPVTGVRNGLFTLSDIRPGVSADTVDIRVFEGGADAEGSPALANDFMVEFKMTGEDVGQLIPANSQVDLTLETGSDSSLPVKVTLFFPALEEEVELDVPSMIKGADDQKLIDQICLECDTLVSNMKIAGAVDSVKLSELESKLEKVKGMFESAGADRGANDQAMHRLREVYRSLAHLEASGSWVELEQELSEKFSELLAAQSKNGNDSTKMQVDNMKERLEKVKASKDVPLAKQLISEMGSLEFQINLFENMAGIIVYCYQNFNSVTWTNSGAARQAVDAGMAAVSNNPTVQSLEPHCQSIMRLVDRSQPGGRGVPPILGG